LVSTAPGLLIGLFALLAASTLAAVGALVLVGVRSWSLYIETRGLRDRLAPRAACARQTATSLSQRALLLRDSLNGLVARLQPRVAGVGDEIRQTMGVWRAGANGHRRSGVAS